MRVHVIQVAYGDDEPFDERVHRVADLVARQRGADLVVLPELWAHTGFGHRTWAARAQTRTGPVAAAMAAAAARAQVLLHAGSIAETDLDPATGAPAAGAPPDPPGTRHHLWNTSLLFGPDGALLTTYRKIHRFGFDRGEAARVDPGDAPVALPVHLDGGPVVLGLATCYDLRFPELFRALGGLGAEMVVLPAAWPAARLDHWQVLGRARAVENQTLMVQCNTAGTHAGHRMAGHSQVVAADGTVLALAGDDEQVLEVDVDLDAQRAYRTSFPVLADRRL